RQLTKWAQWWKDTSGETVKFDDEFVSSYYAREGNPDMEEILKAI
ncbi:12476_t:CDS:1, partial [Funneliformis caledonium]